MQFAKTNNSYLIRLEKGERIIQKLILDPMALKIVVGEIKNGVKIFIDADKNEEIIITTAIKEKSKKIKAGSSKK